MTYRKGSAGYLMSKYKHRKVIRLDTRGKWTAYQERKLWELINSRDYTPYFNAKSPYRVRVPYMPVFHTNLDFKGASNHGLFSYA